jgi:prepilin signal peptidase PulO-like enzyme (type II secretory pathway)
MLNKISGLARALYIVLAIVAGFVALGAMDVALVLVVLGLIAGLSMPRDRMVLAAATVIALPLVGAALAHIPTVGAQLNAVAGNLQLGIAGALATAMAMFLYDLAMDGVTGLSGTGGGGRKAAAAAR